MRLAVYFIGFLSLVLVGCSSTSPEELAQRAQRAYEAKEYAKAITAYERLTRVTPSAPMAFYNLGMAAFAMEDYAYAAQAFEKAKGLVQKGELKDCIEEMQANILLVQKDTEGAKQAYRALVAGATLASVRCRAQVHLAMMAQAQGRMDGALALLLGALADADSALLGECYYNLGKLCMHSELKLWSGALSFFERAEQTLPNGSPLLKDTRNCESQLRGFLERYRVVPPRTTSGNTRDVAMKAAKEAVDKRLWRKAEEQYEKASNADLASFDAAVAWARMCLKNGHRDTALKAYRRAVTLRPEDAAISYEMANLAYQMKLYADALTSLRSAVVMEPKTNRMSDLMARILFAQRRSADARLWGEYYLSLVPQASAARTKYLEWVNNLPQE